MTKKKSLILHDGDVSFLGMPSTREPDPCYTDEVNWFSVEFVGQDRHLATVSIRDGSGKILTWEMSVGSARELVTFLQNALSVGCCH